MLSTINEPGLVNDSHGLKSSLVRAFTTRRSKPDMRINTSAMVGRAASHRAGKPSITRAQISAPLALLSTSNALLNNAQHIAGTRPIQHCDVDNSSAASTSGEESDSSVVSEHSDETDASSVACSSPATPVEPNHLSCYFKPAVDTQAKITVHSRTSSVSPSLDKLSFHTRTSSASPSLDTPKIPQRVPSHSKRAHESCHRQRSIRRMMSPEPTAREMSSTSVDVTAPSTPVIAEVVKESSFGAELSKLDEVVEESGVLVREADDTEVLHMYGLAVFSAVDYMSEIQSLVYQTFLEEESAAAWI